MGMGGRHVVGPHRDQAGDEDDDGGLEAGRLRSSGDGEDGTGPGGRHGTGQMARGRAVTPRIRRRWCKGGARGRATAGNGASHQAEAWRAAASGGSTESDGVWSCMVARAYSK
jgi:hypothetical protein